VEDFVGKRIPNSDFSQNADDVTTKNDAKFSKIGGSILVCKNTVVHKITTP
jgi:hypothetical protein